MPQEDEDPKSLLEPWVWCSGKLEVLESLREQGGKRDHNTWAVGDEEEGQGTLCQWSSPGGLGFMEKAQMPTQRSYNTSNA